VAWMYWTTPTALLFAAVLGTLTLLTVAELRFPSIPRRGWLPMKTTRGDRFFLGLLATAFTHFTWVGATNLPAWPALAISALLLITIGRYA